MESTDQDMVIQLSLNLLCHWHFHWFELPTLTGLEKAMIGLAFLFLTIPPNPVGPWFIADLLSRWYGMVWAHLYRRPVAAHVRQFEGLLEELGEEGGHSRPWVKQQEKMPWYGVTESISLSRVEWKNITHKGDLEWRSKKGCCYMV